MRDITVVAIDTEIDFCDPIIGKLYVQGAEHDMVRFANLIKKNKRAIKKILNSIDMHRVRDIAHPGYWQDINGNHPEPFKTVISLEDVQSGKWFPVNSNWYSIAVDYLTELPKSGRCPLVIWPEHCIYGTVGQANVPVIADAFIEWERSDINNKIIYIEKGLNQHTEHFSFVRADVPVAWDNTTQVNHEVIAQIASSLIDGHLVVVGGEAFSHCINFSISDVIAQLEALWGIEKLKEYAGNIVLLTDCMSSVPGFESFTEAFTEKMKKYGVRFAKSTEI